MQPPSAPTAREIRLRGNYDFVRADYTVDQQYWNYTDDEHRLWSELLTRQRSLLARYASREFQAGVEWLGLHDRLPDFSQISQTLRRRTRWELVGVAGLIPEREFFNHLAARRFPVTVWLRTREEIDYLSQPDLFHDFFGHVPLLTDPAYADFIALYGHAGNRALELGGLKMLARLYWYGIEFGLIDSPAGLRSYGAGILSSYGESRYALDSPIPKRLRFDLQRVLKTDYLIDAYQKNYFVVRSFQELVDAAVQTDFAPLYQSFGNQPGIEPGTVLTPNELWQPNMP